MKVLGIISFIHHITPGFSGPLALPEKWFSVLSVVYWFQRDLGEEDHLLVCIYCNRRFQEVFSCLSCTPRVIMTGVRTGESRRINGGCWNNFTPGIKQFKGFIQEYREYSRRSSSHELMDGRVVGNLVQLEDVFDPAHQIDEFDHIAIVSTKGFTKEKDSHELMLSIRSPGIFAGIKR
jgi:hypothetical protein